jgi:hypothetical protein
MKNPLRCFETILIHTSLQRGVGWTEDDRIVSPTTTYLTQKECDWNVRLSAPKARNAIAWGSAPGMRTPHTRRALKARNNSANYLDGSKIPRLQRSKIIFAAPPGALPQAIAFRAFGALNQILFQIDRQLSQVCYCRFNGFAEAVETANQTFIAYRHLAKATCE